MTAARSAESSAENPWRPLLTALAAPLTVSAILITLWLAGGRESLDGSLPANVILAALGPLNMTWIALALLRRESARPSVLPTPLLMYLTFSSQSVSHPSWYCALFGNIAWLVVLIACIRRLPGVARVGAAICGGIALMLQVSAALTQTH